MKILDVRRLARGAISAQPGRPAMATAYDGVDARVVVFRIEPGEQVHPHTSTSSVVLSVVEGRGVVAGADGERPVAAGDVIVYEPNEEHAMRAEDERMVMHAVITPRPGAR